MSTNLNVEEFKKLDLESQINTFKKNIQLCIDYCAHYRSTVEKRPVFPDVMPGYLRKLLPRMEECFMSLNFFLKMNETE